MLASTRTDLRGERQTTCRWSKRLPSQLYLLLPIMDRVTQTETSERLSVPIPACKKKKIPQKTTKGKAVSEEKRSRVGRFAWTEACWVSTSVVLSPQGGQNRKRLPAFLMSLNTSAFGWRSHYSGNYPAHWQRGNFKPLLSPYRENYLSPLIHCWFLRNQEWQWPTVTCSSNFPRLESQFCMRVTLLKTVQHHCSCTSIFIIIHSTTISL